MKKILSKVGLLFFILGVVYMRDETGVTGAIFLAVTLLGVALYINFGNE